MADEKDQGPMTQALPFDPTTMNAEGALEEIAKINVNATDGSAISCDLATLQALKGAELAHPKYTDGRKTVIDALDAKIAALTPIPEAPAEEPSADESPAEPAPEPVFDGARRIPMPGEKDWHARIGASLIPVEILGDATAYRVRTTQGHPREVVVERSELIAG